MTRRLLGPVCGPIAFVLVAGLVFTGLGWVTHAALGVEAAQRADAARADAAKNLSLALWRLDGRLLPALGVENARAFQEFTAPDPDSAYGPTCGPLLSSPLPDWMKVHTQLDADKGWESPQVLSGEALERFRQAWPGLTLRNATPDRARALDQLRAKHPPKAAFAACAAGDVAPPADLPRVFDAPKSAPLPAPAPKSAGRPTAPAAPPAPAPPAAALRIEAPAAKTDPRFQMADPAPEPVLAPPPRPAPDPPAPIARTGRGANDHTDQGARERALTAAENGRQANGYVMPPPQNSFRVPPFGLDQNNGLALGRGGTPGGEARAFKAAPEVKDGAQAESAGKGAAATKATPADETQKAPATLGALVDYLATRLRGDADAARRATEAEKQNADRGKDYRAGGAPLPPAPAAPFARGGAGFGGGAIPGASGGGFGKMPGGGGLGGVGGPSPKLVAPAPGLPAGPGGAPAGGPPVGGALAGGLLPAPGAIPPPAPPAPAAGIAAMAAQVAPPKGAAPAPPVAPTPDPGPPPRLVEIDEPGPEVFVPAPVPPPVAVHLGPVRPQWLTAADGTDTLVLVRTAKLDGRTVYQGVVLDWPRLRQVLRDDVKDLFPDAALVPLKAAPGDAPPEGAMTTLPVQLDPNLAPPAPPAGWTPLRIGLALAWAAAVVAFGALGLAGWSLIDLSERRIRFVSAVTHELRTPLTSLRLYLDLLLSGMVQDEAKRTEYISTLAVESDRLHRLVDNVLDFARLERRRTNVGLAPANVAELLAGVRETWTDRCGADGKELIVVSTLPPDAAVTTDAALVGQIVGNLIDNARKYTRGASDPRVWVWAKPDGRRVVIEVEDRGPGVPPRERNLIFRPFRRGAAADTTAGGAGLGLALCRQWAESLGGTLTYRPADGDTGSCFRLELPAGGK